ncbi:hypothetical protein LBMAG42_04310 [Deltaproteobacteria bacterium]|nr:hypothetical protein LBMAG42_04310 [Deltaproteobacteria bacterium]
MSDPPSVADAAPLVRRSRPRREEADSAALPARSPGATREAAPRSKGSSKRKREAEPSPGRVQLGQVLTLVALAGSAFVTLSLASWSPSDASFSVANSAPAVMNACGPVGAYTADLLYQAFGWASWSVLVVGAWLVLRLAGRVSSSVWNALLGAFSIWMMATALDLALGHASGRAFPPGGLMGVLTSDALVSHVGRAGGALGVATGLLAALTALFGINWQPLAVATVERVQSGTPKVGRMLGAATLAAGRGAVSIGSRAGSAVRAHFGGDDDDADEEEEELASEAGIPVEARVSPPAAAPQVPARLTARPAPSVDDVVEPVADLPSVHGSVWSAAPAPKPRSLYDAPPVDRATLVSPRTLVEVELDGEPLPVSGSRRSREAFSPAQAAPSAPQAWTPATAPAAPAATARPPAAPAYAPAPVYAAGPPAASDPEGDEYDVPAPRSLGGVHRASPVYVDDDLDGIDDVEPLAPIGGQAPAPVSNAFGMSLDADPPTRPSMSGRPVADPAVFVPAPSIVPVGPAADSFPRPSKGKKQAAVVPGNLVSGGCTDDGGAVRETNQPFQLPPLSLLDEHPAIVGAADESRLHDLAGKLTLKLRDFGVEGRVTAIRPGPVITMFEYEPAPGIKLSKIAALADDVAMAMKALAIRIVAPLPGRGVVGVEVPNEVRHTVWARDVFSSAEFRDQRHTLPIMLGKDTEGRPYVADLTKAPHLLVGGTTGSGKSVGINAMLVSLLMTKTPQELRLILIDPKMLEFELYKEIPHLLHPVVTNATLASKVLAWTCEEMDRRYRLIGDWKVRNIENFNAKVEHESADWTSAKARTFFPEWPAGELIPTPKKLPYIVVVIDELADLMMVASKDVEMSIARIAQKARACGIHLIVATQRPSADVITGLIRSNMPSRMAYQVRTSTESKIILDSIGANQLLGKGDLLFVPPGVSSLTRIHGPFLSDDEVKRVADMCRAQGKPNYAPAIRLDESDDPDSDLEPLGEEMSGYYDEIVELALEKGQMSTSMIQRHLKLGYNRACLLMEQLERNGIVGPADGAKPRKVIAQE